MSLTLLFSLKQLVRCSHLNQLHIENFRYIPRDLLEGSNVKHLRLDSTKTGHSRFFTHSDIPTNNLSIPSESLEIVHPLSDQPDNRVYVPFCTSYARSYSGWDGTRSHENYFSIFGIGRANSVNAISWSWKVAYYRSPVLVWKIAYIVYRWILFRVLGRP